MDITSNHLVALVCVFNTEDHCGCSCVCGGGVSMCMVSIMHYGASSGHVHVLNSFAPCNRDVYLAQCSAYVTYSER